MGVCTFMASLLDTFAASVNKHFLRRSTAEQAFVSKRIGKKDENGGFKINMKIANQFNPGNHSPLEIADETNCMYLMVALGEGGVLILTKVYYDDMGDSPTEITAVTSEAEINAYLNKAFPLPPMQASTELVCVMQRLVNML